MARYHIYFLADDDRIAFTHDIDSDDDAAALLVAEQLLGHTTYLSSEVWHDQRLVARTALNPAVSADPPINKTRTLSAVGRT
jgi:hypothetical protein